MRNRAVAVPITQNRTSEGDRFFDSMAEAIAKKVAQKVLEQIKGQIGSAEKIFFSMSEAAELMGLSKSTIKTMIRSRELACIRRGSRVLINRRTIDKWAIDKEA